MHEVAVFGRCCGFAKQSVEGWRPWAAFGVTAGGIKVYSDAEAGPGGSLAFCTVRGAGHGVPQHRPASMLALLSAVVAGEELPRVPARNPRL